jgi:hypothetical protein
MPQISDEEATVLTKRITEACRRELSAMRKYDDLWDELNTLLYYLRSDNFSVVHLVNEHFLVKHGNAAPGILLQQQIQKLQKRLDESPTDANNGR